MKKDEFGIYLNFYAGFAFLLAILGQTLLCGLLLGFVILVQQDIWLTRQTMQAALLSFVSGIINTVIGVFSPLYAIPVVGALISGLFGLVTGIISLIILIIAIIALCNVAKGKEANVPFFKKIADKAFGLVQTIAYAQPAPGTEAPQESSEKTEEK